MRLVPGGTSSSRRTVPALHRHLVFGVNDPTFGNASTREAAAGLGLNQYAVPVQWKPGQQITGHELGTIPRNQNLLVYLYGLKADAPRTPVQRAQYAQYARDLVKRNPNIRELQVWNEPSVDLFWGGGKQGMQQYVPLLARTYDALRGSHTQVVSPGSYPGLAQQLQFVNSVKNFYKHNPGRKRPLFDAYATHPYWDADKTNAVAKAMNNQWRGTPQHAPRQGLKFWWTETGSESDPGGTPPADYGGGYTGEGTPWRLSGTPQTQATKLRQMVSLAEKNPLVAGIFNFLLYDEPDLSRWQSGLLTPTGQRKPAYTALQQVIASARKRGY